MLEHSQYNQRHSITNGEIKMALVECKECGKEISSKVGGCPHCGRKRTADPSFSDVIKALPVIIIILVVAYCGFGGESEEGRKIRYEKSEVERNIKDEKKAPLIAKWTKDTNVPFGKFFFETANDNFSDVPSPKQLNAIVYLIRLNGYKCDVLEKVSWWKGWDGSFSVYCNSFHYSYSVKDEGGNWVVELK